MKKDVTDKSLSMKEEDEKNIYKDGRIVKLMYKYQKKRGEMIFKDDQKIIEERQGKR